MITIQYLLKGIFLSLFILCIFTPINVSAFSNKCTGLFSTNVTALPFKISIKSIGQVLKSVALKLKTENSITEPDNDNSDNLFAAFFGMNGLGGRVEINDEWIEYLHKMKIKQVDINNSWSLPVQLFPLPIVLFKGFLFPEGYFLRQTTYFNEYGMLKRIYSFDPLKFAKQMPFIKIKEQNQFEVVKDGGSIKIFELLKENLNKKQKINLFRGCSVEEARLQYFIQKLLNKKLNSPIDELELNELAALIDKTQLNDNSGSYPDSSLSNTLVNTLLLFKKNRPSKLEVAKQLASTLGVFSHGTFVTNNMKNASSFINNSIQTSVKENIKNALIYYSIPVAELEPLIGSSVYLGFEGDIEILFVENPLNQKAKFLLYKSIIKIQNTEE